jgi:hypothetical protein
MRAFDFCLIESDFLMFTTGQSGGNTIFVLPRWFVRGLEGRKTLEWVAGSFGTVVG